MMRRERKRPCDASSSLGMLCPHPSSHGHHWKQACCCLDLKTRTALPGTSTLQQSSSSPHSHIHHRPGVHIHPPALLSLSILS